jgi:hypothetical protein
MADAQTKKVEAMTDTNYNLLSLLTNTLEEVDVLNVYIEDAQESGDQDLVDMFTRIRDQSSQHAQMLRETVVQRCQNGKFT